LAQSIPAIQKIYGTVIYAADYDVAKNATSVLRDEGSLHVAGMDVAFTSVPGHSLDSMVYKIGHVIFTGDVLSAGHLGSTVSNYSKRTLVANIERKIFCHTDSTVLFPAHGPPTSIGAEKLFNQDIRGSAAPNP
jgi:glyoxylase-like metal-dependent hydrolase (beta-lactamase superfamily II)